jgi:hypothetical protein
VAVTVASTAGVAVVAVVVDVPVAAAPTVAVVVAGRRRVPASPSIVWRKR